MKVAVKKVDVSKVYNVEANKVGKNNRFVFAIFNDLKKKHTSDLTGDTLNANLSSFFKTVANTKDFSPLHLLGTMDDRALFDILLNDVQMTYKQVITSALRYVNLQMNEFTINTERSKRINNVFKALKTKVLNNTELIDELSVELTVACIGLVDSKNISKFVRFCPTKFVESYDTLIGNFEPTENELADGMTAESKFLKVVGYKSVTEFKTDVAAYPNKDLKTIKALKRASVKQVESKGKKTVSDVAELIAPKGKKANKATKETKTVIVSATPKTTNGKADNATLAKV